MFVTGGDDDVLLQGRPEIGIERGDVDGVRHDESSLPRMPLEGFDTQLRIDDRHHGSTIRLRTRELKSRWTRMTWTAARLHSMESIVLLCTDGSDVSIKALRSSLPILAPPDRIIVVTVESPTDPELTTGTGFSGRSSEDLSEQIATSGDYVAKQRLDATIDALGLDDVELMALVGQPGEAICELAASLPATAIVMGTSGRTRIPSRHDRFDVRSCRPPRSVPGGRARCRPALTESTEQPAPRARRATRRRPT